MKSLLNTRSHGHQNLYLPLIENDMFYFKQICKIISIHGRGFHTNPGRFGPGLLRLGRFGQISIGIEGG